MNDNQNNDNAFWKFFWDVSVVVAAAFLYFKTSEVMTAIAPLTLVGQTGLQTIYGLGVAALIEGVCLAIHFIGAFKTNTAAQTYKWFLFGVSAFCQFMDRFFVLDPSVTSANIEFFKFLTYGIPVFILGGLLLVGKANERRVASRTPSKPFKGVRNVWREFMDGSQENTRVSREVVGQLDEEVPELESLGSNGSNPTNRRR
jgi:hypothetical protein